MNRELYKLLSTADIHTREEFFYEYGKSLCILIREGFLGVEFIDTIWECIRVLDYDCNYVCYP